MEYSKELHTAESDSAVYTVLESELDIFPQSTLHYCIMHLPNQTTAAASNIALLILLIAKHNFPRNALSYVRKIKDSKQWPEMSLSIN